MPRILFAGSPEIAVPSLKAISEMELEGKGVVLAGILTNPDSKRSRHGLEPTDVSAAALELDTKRVEMGFRPIIQLKPERLDAKARAEVAALEAELLVSFAYGKIFGPLFLAMFQMGGINIHPSLLPKYRGASPMPAVILAREKETGICIQRLAPEMDAGDILATDYFELDGRETTSSLGKIVSLRSASLLGELLANFDAMDASARPQNGETTYCAENKKEEGLIDWNKSAIHIDAQIRAYTPWPLSFTSRGKDMLFILEAEPVESGYFQRVPDSACSHNAVPGTVLGTDKNRGILIQTGDGILAVKKLQLQAKKALDWRAFCNGIRDFEGEILGQKTLIAG